MTASESWSLTTGGQRLDRAHRELPPSLAERRPWDHVVGEDRVHAACIDRTNASDTTTSNLSCRVPAAPGWSLDGLAALYSAEP